MGYPDIIGDASKIIGSRKIDYRDDSAAICKRHGLDYHLIPDANSFFEMLGCKLTVFDIVRERGNEIILDLNEHQDVAQQFDFVLDVGTMEHCFNIGQAALNMAMMVKIGGTILHENPFNWANHGFYGLNPTWYADFYEQNGFDLQKCYFVLRDGRMMKDVPQTKRFMYKEPVEANIFAMARRIEDMPFVWPTQTKYKPLLG